MSYNSMISKQKSSEKGGGISARNREVTNYDENERYIGAGGQKKEK